MRRVNSIEVFSCAPNTIIAKGRCLNLVQCHLAAILSFRARLRLSCTLTAKACRRGYKSKKCNFWSASLLLIKFYVIPLRQPFDECEWIEWEFGNIHTWLPCSLCFWACILDACEREGTGFPYVRVFLDPQLVASLHNVEHPLGRKHGEHLTDRSTPSLYGVCVVKGVPQGAYPFFLNPSFIYLT
jgi:hypothetical protein